MVGKQNSMKNSEEQNTKDQNLSIMERIKFLLMKLGIMKKKLAVENGGKGKIKKRFSEELKSKARNLSIMKWIKFLQMKFGIRKRTLESNTLLDEPESFTASAKEKKILPLSSCSELPLIEMIINMQRGHIPLVDKKIHTIDFFKECENRLEVLDTLDGHLMSSKISVKGKKVYLHHLQKREMQQPPPLFSMELTALMKYFVNPGRDSVTCFLDLSWGDSLGGRLHIIVSPYSLPLARQFTILCTGHLGHSYAHTNFFQVWSRDKPYEHIRGGDYETNDGAGGAGIIQGIDTEDEVYRRPYKTGTIWTHSFNTKGNNGQFFINTGSGIGFFSGVFGQVKDGFDVSKGAAERLKDGHNDVEVVDCGVVLHL